MSLPGGSSKWLWLLLLASLAFNAGVGTTFGVRAYRSYCTAFDEHDRPGRPGGPGHGFRMHEELNLTPEQHARIREATSGVKQRGHALRDEVRHELEVLVELMAEPEPDREAIAAQVTTIARLREQLDHHMVEHFLDTRQLLEPDQYEAFNKMIHHALSRGRHCRGACGGPHGPHRGAGHGKGPVHHGNE